MTTATTADYKGNILVFRDPDSDEHVLPVAPILFVEDFFSIQLDLDIWQKVEVGTGAVQQVTNAAGGIVSLGLTVSGVEADAVLYWLNQRKINLKKDAIWEARVQFATSTPGSASRAVFGVATDHNLDKDSITASAWFRVDGSTAPGGALTVETDDNVTNNDDISTSLSLVVGTWYVFRIDFSELTDVKFYVDGVQVAASTTFDMSGLTDVLAVVQPYFSMDATTTVNVSTDLRVDYVRCWSRR